MPVFSWPPMLPGLMRMQCAPGVDRLQRQRVVEVDVGDDRDRRLDHDRAERVDVLLARDGAADDVAAGVRDGADLAQRRLVVGGLGLRHRLDGDRRSAADLDPADVDLSLRSHSGLRVSALCPIQVRMSLQSVLARISEIQGAMAPVQPAPDHGARRPRRPAGERLDLVREPAPERAAPGSGASAGCRPPPRRRRRLRQGRPGHLPPPERRPRRAPRAPASARGAGRPEGQKFHVTSGHRSIEEQQRLWDNRHNNPFPVARPGTSRHQTGRACRRDDRRPADPGRHPGRRAARRRPRAARGRRGHVELP